MALLGLEPLLVERLREKVRIVRAVLTTADLAGVSASAQVTPAVHVVFGGFRVVESIGREAQLEQDWMTVVCAKNASQRADAVTALREDAGSVADEVIGALMGWRPSKEFTPLQIANSRRPMVVDGNMYLPIGWSVRMVVRAD